MGEGGGQRTVSSAIASQPMKALARRVNLHTAYLDFDTHGRRFNPLAHSMPRSRVRSSSHPQRGVQVTSLDPGSSPTFPLAPPRRQHLTILPLCRRGQRSARRDQFNPFHRLPTGHFSSAQVNFWAPPRSSTPRPPHRSLLSFPFARHALGGHPPRHPLGAFDENTKRPSKPQSPSQIRQQAKEKKKVLGKNITKTPPSALVRQSRAPIGQMGLPLLGNR